MRPPPFSKEAHDEQPPLKKEVARCKRVGGFLFTISLIKNIKNIK
jgi:hypothetical protein